MQPRNEKVVAPRKRWAKLAKWTTAKLHGRRSPIVVRLADGSRA
jgi:hypothetical protein